MEHEDWFVDNEIRDLKIEGMPGFKYKLPDAKTENSWAREYMKVDLTTGEGIPDLEQMNKCKIRNIVEVPFSNELIKAKSGLEKEWKDLTGDQKWQILGKLKPALFGKILDAINAFNIEPEEKKTS